MGDCKKKLFSFEKPCLILRPQTEWKEIVENGNAILVGASKSQIIEGFNFFFNKVDLTFPALYGDGAAANFICQKILEEL